MPKLMYLVAGIAIGVYYSDEITAFFREELDKKSSS